MLSPETPILNETAIAEIESRHARVNSRFEELVILTPAERNVLCATVRHLRWQVDLYEKAFELDDALKLSEVGDLNALQVVRKMADLQSQLEQLRTIAAGALRFRVEMNGACNHDQYMTKLCTQCEIREALEKL